MFIKGCRKEAEEHYNNLCKISNKIIYLYLRMFMTNIVDFSESNDLFIGYLEKPAYSLNLIYYMK